MLTCPLPATRGRIPALGTTFQDNVKVMFLLALKTRNNDNQPIMSNVCEEHVKYETTKAPGKTGLHYGKQISLSEYSGCFKFHT